MSVNTVSPNRVRQIAALQKLIAGFKKHQPTVTLLLVLGQSLKVADILVMLQKRLDTTSAVDAAKATWQNAVKADYDQRTLTDALLAGIRQALLVAFAGQVDVLADFGLVGRKTAVVPPEKRVAAAAKAKATRAARHTLGKKQKAAIKGDVAGAVVAPAPVDKAAPAPAAPAATAPQTPPGNPSH